MESLWFPLWGPALSRPEVGIAHNVFVTCRLLASLILAAAPLLRAADFTEVRLGDRVYQYHLPRGHDCGTRNLPAVLFLHAEGEGAAAARERMGTEVADANCYVAVWAQADGFTWTAADVDYIRLVLDSLGTTIDPLRVYVVGHRDGAVLAFRLACELSGRITAFAPMEGSLSCTPPRPIPAIAWDADVDALRDADGLPSTPTTLVILPSAKVPGVKDTISSWLGGRVGSAVIQHKLSGVDADWIYAQPPPFDWQTENWKFFTQYALPFTSATRHRAAGH